MDGYKMKNINETWMKQRSFRRLVRTNMKNANGGNGTPINNESVSTARSNRFARMGRPINTTSVSEGISICLTAWKTADYIEECLDSIENQSWFKTHDNFEVLLGIDACEETLAKVKEIMHKYRNLSVYMMEKNVGTYVTTNTMMNLAQYEWLLRFDTDDIMLPNMIETLMTRKGNAEFVRFQMENFTESGVKCNRSKIQLAHGPILMKKTIFLKFKGYKDWVCSGDSDLIKRVKHYCRYFELKEVCFRRRIQKNSLTVKKDTNNKSEERRRFNKLLGDNNNYSTLAKCINDEIITNPFYEIYKK